MNFNDNFDLKKAKSFLLTENFQVDETENLEEMAQITGALKAAIEDVIETNPELNGLALKKAIRSNADVIDALAGDDLYDNQLNRFISLSKGERENQPRGRKAGVPNAVKSQEPSGEEEYEDPNQLKMDLEEMAKISGDLKAAIEDVIDSNPELEGLALKKAIKADSSVQDALAGDDLYDNQLNRFISLSKGERENQPRGRKAGTPNAVKSVTSTEDDIEVEDPNQLKMDFDTKPETIKIKTPSTPKPAAPAAAPAKERDLAQEIKDAEAEVKRLGLAAIKSQDPGDMAKAKAATAKLKALRAEVK
jgi:hypothetical protein